jgi:signal transduction histidine kinase
MAQALLRRHLMVLVMLTLAGLGWLVEAHFEVFEWFHAVSRPYEAFQLDGLMPGILLVLFGAFLDTYRAYHLGRRERERLRVMMEMATTVAHEINDPLTTLIAQLELASDEIAADHPLRPRLSTASEAAWRIAERVRRLNELREYRPRDVGVGPRVIDLSARGGPP